jgi:hypothetical protein
MILSTKWQRKKSGRFPHLELFQRAARFPRAFVGAGALGARAL